MSSGLPARQVPQSLVFTRSVVIAAIGILAWRGASLWQATDFWFALTMNGVGLAFLAGGLDTLCGRRFLGSGLAGAYLMCQSLHWGGPAVIGSQVQSIVFYVLVSGVLAQALLLHFAIVMFLGELKTWQRVMIYCPVVLVTLMGVGAALFFYGPAGFMTVHVVQDNFYAVISLLLLLARSGRSRWFGYALLAAWLPPILLEVLNGSIGHIDIGGRGIEPFNVLYIAIPIGFLFAQRVPAKTAS